MPRRSEKQRPGEFALIARYFAPLAKSPYAFGLQDDVALLQSRGNVVLKTDSSIESVHFLREDPAGTIAQKALRRTLSDLAAKGAEPLGYLLALALPDWVGGRWLRAFVRGLRSDQRRFAISLLGGDTAHTPGPLSIAVTMVGRLPARTFPRRSGARPGDCVFVSGTLGDAGLGLELLQARKRAPLGPIRRYRLPEPRLALGAALRNLASGSIDVSDGLLADLGHIASTSGVEILVDAARIPLSQAVREHWQNKAVLQAATAGDDYEIAFTCAPRARERVLAAARKARTRVTEIGVARAGRGIVLLDARGRPIRVPSMGYEH